MSQAGLGVLINRLCGSAESADAVKVSLGKTIARARVEDNELRVTFTDGTRLELWDDGQSCCESRYMVCDDDTASVEGATLMRIELREAPSGADGDDDCHDVEFLALVTSKGELVVSNHNEHNGYYGGFYVKARLAETQS